MTRDRDESSHPAPHRGRVDTHEALFAVCGAPLAWLVQLSANFAMSASPCFVFGERQLTHPGVQPGPLIVGGVCLVVALAALWLSIVLLRRTREETGGGKHHLLETGHGRTRFLALWGIAFAAVFGALIAINIVLLFGLPICAG